MRKFGVLGVLLALAVFACQVDAQCVGGMCYRGAAFQPAYHGQASEYVYGAWGVPAVTPVYRAPWTPIRNAIRRVLTPRMQYYASQPAMGVVEVAPVVGYCYAAAPTTYSYSAAPTYYAAAARPYYGGGGTIGVLAGPVCTRATCGGAYVIR